MAKIFKKIPSFIGKDGPQKPPQNRGCVFGFFLLDVSAFFPLFLLISCGFMTSWNPKTAHQMRLQAYICIDSENKKCLPTVSRQFLTSNAPSAQIVSQNASQTVSRQNERAVFLFQNYPCGEGNRETRIVSHQFLSRDIKMPLLDHWATRTK